MRAVAGANSRSAHRVVHGRKRLPSIRRYGRGCGQPSRVGVRNSDRRVLPSGQLAVLRPRGRPRLHHDHHPTRRTRASGIRLRFPLTFTWGRASSPRQASSPRPCGERAVCKKRPSSSMWFGPLRSSSWTTTSEACRRTPGLSAPWQVGGEQPSMPLRKPSYSWTERRRAARRLFLAVPLDVGPYFGAAKTSSRALAGFNVRVAAVVQDSVARALDARPNSDRGHSGDRRGARQ